MSKEVERAWNEIKKTGMTDRMLLAEEKMKELGFIGDNPENTGKPRRNEYMEIFDMLKEESKGKGFPLPESVGELAHLVCCIQRYAEEQRLRTRQKVEELIDTLTPLSYIPRNGRYRVIRLSKVIDEIGKIFGDAK